jgi:hypothetical protein
MGVSNIDGDGGGVDGDGSEGKYLSRQGVGTETSIPQTSSLMVTVLRKFHGLMPIFLGFLRRRQFIDGRAMSESA